MPANSTTEMVHISPEMALVMFYFILLANVLSTLCLLLALRKIHRAARRLQRLARTLRTHHPFDELSSSSSSTVLADRDEWLKEQQPIVLAL